MLEDINISALYTDWALVLFTTFAQFAVGTALFASILTAVSEGLDAGLQEAIEEREARKKLWRASFTLLILSFFLSFFHLKNPFTSLFNMEDASFSALNVESIFVLIFFFLLLFQSIKLTKITGYFTSFFGIVTNYILADVYIAGENISIWNKVGSLFAFYGTVFVLGSAFALWCGRKLDNDYFKKYAAFFLIFGFICSLSAKTTLLFVFMLEDFTFASHEFQQGLYTLILQAFLAITGLLCMLSDKNTKHSWLLALGVFCFLMAEVFSRLLFFLTQFKISA